MPGLTAGDLWADVARIRIKLSADGRRRFGVSAKFGSGRLIGRNLVLTARHVLENDKGEPLPDIGWEVRLLGDRDGETWTDEPIAARVSWRGSQDIDLALLQLVGVERVANKRIRLRLGRYDSVRDLDGVWVAGYPDAARVARKVANEYSAPGKLRKAADKPSYRLSIVDAPQSGDGWAGCSGGNVLFWQRDIVWILGVVTKVPRTFGSGALDVVPVENALAADRDFSRLLEEFGSLDGSLAHAEDLAKLPGPYEFVGVEAHAASRRTIDATLNTSFYGRSSDLAELDNALANDRSVTLLRGEAGLGKSALAARWAARHAIEAGTTVLHHAFSVREWRLGTRQHMIENLVRQVAFSKLGPEALGPPGDLALLDSRLADLLGQDQPAGTRLVIILDALEEAAELIDPWATDLGRGVHVLGTFRAESGETPSVLRLWRERYAHVSGCSDTAALAREFQLLPLDASGIAEWLTEAEGKVLEPTDPLVTRALTASEGVPLFASFLIPFAIGELRKGAADPFPVSFAEYADQRLVELETAYSNERPGWSWDNVLKLFALLTVAKVPLPPAWLHEHFNRARLDRLDQRIDRWLWRRAEGVSFAHPRLASIFGSVLSNPKFDVSVSAIEDELITACNREWKTENGQLMGYALAWLPTHLMCRQQADKAAQLLCNAAFVFARLGADPTAATVSKTASETLSLDRRIASVNSDLAGWRRFWSETEAPVQFALVHAERLEVKPPDLLAQLVRDRFGAESPIFRRAIRALAYQPPLRPRLAHACGFRHPSLLRSVDDAHLGWVYGVLALDDGLVSWGSDGAIRFWDRQGNARGGGDLNAHAGSVHGVLEFDGAFLSWGSDGAIRFWDCNGEIRAGGGAMVYAGSVVGILALDDGLVSWGSDGAIRFWDRQGKMRPGGDVDASAGPVVGMLALEDGFVSWTEYGKMLFWDLEGKRRPGSAKAHVGPVVGVLSLDDGLVSWGEDGAIRFWEHQGSMRAGGDAKAHTGPVVGVIALDDGFVSWGEDGAIRFWDRQGNGRTGGDPKAHSAGVVGVLALDDGFVSGGEDGAIRFWDLRGKRRAGGDSRAHAGPVVGVLSLDDGLLSWGEDGAIRFWDRRGKTRSGGDPKAHSGPVSDVLALDDALVSWGEDGAIRFWDRQIKVPAAGDPKGHSGEVASVLAIDDRLVSWGEDGAINLWDRQGKTWAGGDPNAHSRSVIGVLALDDALVSWGEDGAIRFWDRHGKPRLGGDSTAHEGWVRGVLTLDDALVSWGEDGAIRFWDRQGNARTGGDSKAHLGAVVGVLALDDALVSWGYDGEIRFWDRRGKIQAAGERKAHSRAIGGVLTLDDALVSWGEDGAIRFWDQQGKTRVGGDSAAHEGWVRGVLALDDALVSWGEDGAIRFWDRQGKRRVGGSSTAHTGWVRGVLALDDALVSWGEDGAIRFWDRQGKRRAGGDPKAHAGWVRGVLALDNALVSWGDDRAVRFWDRNGIPAKTPWLALGPVNFMTVIDDELWLGLNGRPSRLLW